MFNSDILYRNESALYIILCSVFILLVKFFWENIIKPEIRQYKKLPDRDKDYYGMLILIFIVPFLLWVIDALNIFSNIFPYYKNITREYDWLSFIGSYSSAIVSAFLLIMITEQDRKANNMIMRYVQRPYLDVSYMKIKREFFEKKDEDILILNHGLDEPDDKLEYLTLCVKNNGESVAIIDPNRLKIILGFENKNELQTHETTINLAVNILTIKSGEEVYIKFLNETLYKKGKLLENSKIIYSIVYYRDLFGVTYVDECKLEDNLKILRDNEIVSSDEDLE